MLARADQGVGDLEGVDDPVAGVADVEGGTGQACLRRDDVGVGGFTDIGADGREEEQVDVGGAKARGVQEPGCGASGEVGRQVRGVRESALAEAEGALYQAGRECERGAVPAQALFDLAGALASGGQVDRGVGDAAVGVHALPFASREGRRGPRPGGGYR
ncbi:hypothetical protein GCM10020254_80310 [Streptomyces goshikiensis]